MLRNRKFASRLLPFSFAEKKNGDAFYKKEADRAREAIHEKGTLHGSREGVAPCKAIVTREMRSGKTILLSYSIKRVTLVMTRSYSTSLC